MDMRLEIVGAVLELGVLLLRKNAGYGNSAADPLAVFSRLNAVERLGVRMDDKLSRIARGREDGQEDTRGDLAGYLVLDGIVRGFGDGAEPRAVGEVLGLWGEVCGLLGLGREEDSRRGAEAQGKTGRDLTTGDTGGTGGEGEEGELRAERGRSWLLARSLECRLDELNRAFAAARYLRRSIGEVEEELRAERGRSWGLAECLDKTEQLRLETSEWGARVAGELAVSRGLARSLRLALEGREKELAELRGYVAQLEGQVGLWEARVRELEGEGEEDSRRGAEAQREAGAGSGLTTGDTGGSGEEKEGEEVNHEGHEGARREEGQERNSGAVGLVVGDWVELQSWPHFPDERLYVGNRGRVVSIGIEHDLGLVQTDIPCKVRSGGALNMWWSVEHLVVVERAVVGTEEGEEDLTTGDTGGSGERLGGVTPVGLV